MKPVSTYTAHTGVNTAPDIHEGGVLLMTSLVVQIPDKIQDDADAVIQSLGMTASDVVRVVMTRIATEKALPLDLFQPNVETVQALQDAEDGRVERITLEGIRALIRDDG